MGSSPDIVHLPWEFEKARVSRDPRRHSTLLFYKSGPREGKRPGKVTPKAKLLLDLGLPIQKISRCCYQLTLTEEKTLSLDSPGRNCI